MGTNGVFYLSNQEANGGGLADLSVVYGTGGDVPLAGRWQNIATCEIDPANGVNLYLYRAPIQGNPVEASISPSAGDRKYLVTNIAKDPLTETLWMYVPDFQAEKGFGWLQAGWAGDPITKMDTQIAYLPSDEGGALKPQTDQQASMQACVDVLPDQTMDYPVANVPWRNPNNVPSNPPQFTHLPVSVAQLCTGQFNYEIHGFGYGTGTNYPRPGFHMGVDFFAPTGSNVYSIANNGIIAGIAIYDGIGNRNENSVYRWGGAENFDGKGYAVIVRHKDLYVLYGHLQNIDSSIYVGRKVSAGTKLGTLGRFNTPHLHIEIRSFGVALNPDTLINQNIYGILKFDGEQPKNVYDITQFFAASNVVAWNNDAQTSTSPVSGLGFSIQNNSVVSASGCQSFKYLLETTSISASGYRGFLLNESLTAPHDPVIPSIPPSGAPVE